MARVSESYLGTSHRRPTVEGQLARLQQGLAELFDLPPGHEVLLGNGGTSLFWDAATFSLIGHRSQHLAFGEFSSKFAKAVAAAPFLEEPQVIEAEPGDHPQPTASPGVDSYCLTHNETSTGVMMELERPEGADPDSLVLVDATSAAGAARWSPEAVDAYYFAPQKALASDGGLWLAVLSPAALERVDRLAADRWIPAILDLSIARASSLKSQTMNTPALATVFLAAEQVDWILTQGGLEWAEKRCTGSSGLVYEWASEREFATPFVADPAKRSIVVTTVDFEGLDAAVLASHLRANGILDVEPYRKLGRNQLRIATFPAIDPNDIRALLASIDHVAQLLLR